MPHDARPAQPRTAVMRSEVRHEDGRLLVTAIGSYTIFPPRARARPRPVGPPALGDRSAPRTLADDRRLGLRRRRRDPGRPEGVRALRRARHDRDHGDHRAEHRRRQRDPSAAPGDDPRPGARGRRGHRRRRGQGGDARHGRDRRGPSLAASTSCPTGTPVVVDPVMVAESGARLLDADAQRALIEEILPRATVLTPNLPEARVLAGGGGGETQRTSAGVDEGRGRASRGSRPRAARARAARGRPHRRPSRARGRPVPRRPATAPPSSIEGSATPTAPRTARAARTPRCSPRSSRSAARRCRPRASLALSRAPSRTGCATSARAPVRSTCSASRSERPGSRRLAEPAATRARPLFAIIGER